MSIDVQEKTIQACASAVYAASQMIWAEAETAAATAAAKKAESLGASELRQQGEATKARHDAASARSPLVWEVFAKPGRWLGRWEMAPAFPDGRLESAAREQAQADGALVVGPADTEATIAGSLQSLLDPAPQTV